MKQFRNRVMEAIRDTYGVKSVFGSVASLKSGSKG